MTAKMDFSDIGGPSEGDEESSVLLRPMGDGKWQKIVLSKTSPAEFIEALADITYGGVVPNGKGRTGVSEDVAKTHSDRERILNTLIEYMSFRVLIPGLTEAIKKGK